MSTDDKIELILFSDSSGFILRRLVFSVEMNLS